MRGAPGNLHFRANFASRAVKFRDLLEFWAAIMVWTMWEMVRAQLVLDVITVDLLPFSLLPLLLVLLVLGLFFFPGFVVNFDNTSTIVVVQRWLGCFGLSFLSHFLYRLCIIS